MANSAAPPEEGPSAGALWPGGILHLDYRPAAGSAGPLAASGGAQPPRKELRLLTVRVLHSPVGPGPWKRPYESLW